MTLHYENLSSNEKAAVNRLIGRDSEGAKATGKYYCRTCFKLYVREGDCRRHVYAEHFSTVQDYAEEIKKEWEKKALEFEKQNALNLGNTYFDDLEGRIEYMLKEVKRFKKGYEKARDQKPYENGYQPPLDNMVQEIQACIHHVTNNFNHDVSTGVRAVQAITKSFDFDV